MSLKSDQIKVYIFPRLNNKTHLVFLSGIFGQNKPSRRLYEYDTWTDEVPFVQVLQVADADVILVPHNFSTIRDCHDYLIKISEVSRSSKKPLYLFMYGDSHQTIGFNSAYVFRTSQYGRRLLRNEVIIPPLVPIIESVADADTCSNASLPVVGFVGWAKYPEWSVCLKAWSKHLFYWFLGTCLDERYYAMSPGVVIRAKILKALASSKKVVCNFLIRSSYFGHVDTLRMNEQSARSQYLDSICRTDCTLCPKGDGNFSLRFFEVLSLGRIPVLPDTDVVLPFADTIPYDRFVIRVPMSEIYRTGEVVSDWFAKRSAVDISEAHMLAKKYFLEKLSVPSVCKTIFSRTYFEKLSSLKQ